MEHHQMEEKHLEQLRRQRDRFAIAAGIAVFSIALMVPHQVASYRELASINEQTVSVEAKIVEQQQQLVAVQNQILRIQDQIRQRVSK